MAIKIVHKNYANVGCTFPNTQCIVNYYETYYSMLYMYLDYIHQLLQVAYMYWIAVGDPSCCMFHSTYCNQHSIGRGYITVC